MEVTEALVQVIKNVFNDDEIEIWPEMTANDVAGWDSFSHMTLIAAVENRFQITFTRKEAMSFKCVGDLVKCVETKVNVRQ
ncbi:MAG: acyl carrier protein [Candidatus Omnitrophota bacterium]